LSKVKSYFEKNAHLHVYHNDPQIYNLINAYIKENYGSKQIKILDIGCGEGPFLKRISEYNIKADFFGVDVSHSMIKRARNSLSNNDTILLVSDGFNLPIRSSFKFDIIHADSVLHHIIGKNRKKSKQLVKIMLDQLSHRLTHNGSIIVEEVYYNSYFKHSITTFFIFYFLKILNFMHLDISKILKEFSLGLEVNFFPEMELEKTLKEFGDVTLIKRIPWKVPRLYKLLLLKKYGHISYIVKIKKQN
jgi:SAM-dependent methyltransferase